MEMVKEPAKYCDKGRITWYYITPAHMSKIIYFFKCLLDFRFASVHSRLEPRPCWRSREQILREFNLMGSKAFLLLYTSNPITSSLVQRVCTAISVVIGTSVVFNKLFHCKQRPTRYFTILRSRRTRVSTWS